MITIPLSKGDTVYLSALGLQHFRNDPKFLALTKNGGTLMYRQRAVQCTAVKWPGKKTPDYMNKAFLSKVKV